MPYPTRKSRRGRPLTGRAEERLRLTTGETPVGSVARSPHATLTDSETQDADGQQVGKAPLTATLYGSPSLPFRDGSRSFGSRAKIRTPQPQMSLAAHHSDPTQEQPRAKASSCIYVPIVHVMGLKAFYPLGIKTFSTQSSAIH